MIEPGSEDELSPFEQWDDDEDDFDSYEPPSWRRPLLISVAALTAVALALVPIYNVFRARSVADNGLEICGFDYCVVQEAVTEAGVDLTVSRLNNTLLDEAESQGLADALTDFLDIRPVSLSVVDELDGRLGGVYDPGTRSILIERPARAWTVIHEVAHAVETGHGDDFQRLVIELAQWVESES